MATNTFERKIEIKSKESINKLMDVMKSEAPKKSLSKHPFSTRDRKECSIIKKILIPLGMLIKEIARIPDNEQPMVQMIRKIM